MNADGSGAEPVTDKLLLQTEDSHRWPLFLPDGEHFLFLAASFGTTTDLTNSFIYLSSVHGKEKQKIVQAQSNPGYADGHLFYMDGKRALASVALNISKGIAGGDSRVIADVVGYQPSVYWGAFSVAENGTVVYSASAMASRSVLTWQNRTGKELQRVGEQTLQANPMLSPDETQATVDITDLRTSNLDVWIQHLKSGTSTRFTFDPAEETTPVWSRDGSQIAYRSVSGGSSIFVKNANGMSAARSLVKVGRGKLAGGFEASDLLPNSWTSDGKQILCSMQTIAGGARGSLLVLVPTAGGNPVAFLPGTSSETNGQISADGKWVAYSSNETGAWEIYVTTFPGAQGKWQVSRGGGSEPRWRGDGREIFYLDPASMMMSVPVEAVATFSSGTPVQLFQVRGRAPISSTDLFTYDVSKDGQRFLVNQYMKPEHIEPLTIVQHALADLPK